MIRVLVVHGGGMEGVALERTLAEEAGVRVQVSTTAARTRLLLRTEPPDVVVTDARRATDAGELGLPGAGVRWVAQVRVQEEDAIGDVLLAGASGVFSDRTPGPGLVDAVRQVAAGRGWVAPELVPLLLGEHLPYRRRRALARQRIAALGENEVRLLTLVAQGRTNAEIAGELHLAVSTIKEYVGVMLAQLRVTRTEAVALAVRADLPALTEHPPQRR